MDPMTCMHVCFSEFAYELFVLVQEATETTVGEEATVMEDSMEMMAVEDTVGEGGT